MPSVTMQFPASISVANLNGKNGFVINGFSANSYSGTPIGVGDINGDGIADLVIWSLGAFGEGGIYAIYGKFGLGGSGILNIQGLDQRNGFNITGFPPSSFGGTAISIAGDINNDGIGDFVIGTPGADASYVLFGKLGIRSSEVWGDSSLTGTNGFEITGFPALSYGGTSVSGAGDINGDGIADLVIGAPFAFNGAGASYAIFGKSGIGSSGTFNISNLTGSNGYPITGLFPASSHGGDSLSGVGDINDDGIDDIVIGAPEASSNAGEGYVVFGNRGVANGFYINGFPASSYGGSSVSALGDINGDGIADLLIAAPSPFSGIGESYVIFGKSGIGNFGYIDVFNLNGANGFAVAWFSGETVTVTAAGDINGDGIADLLIGPYGSGSYSSVCYVVFGYSGIGSSGTLSAFNLIGSNGFTITGFPGGSNGGWTANGVGDINGDGLADFVIATPNAFNAAGASYVFFGEPNLITLSKNNLIINQGQTVVFGSQYLNATNSKNPTQDSTLQFIISNIQHGHFFISSNSSAFISNFLQQQVRNGQIQFTHDGSLSPPSYSVSVGYSGMFATTLPQIASISFDVPPTLVKNTLTINQGQTVVLTSYELSASDPYSSVFTFTVSNVQHGYFSLTSTPTIPKFSFTQTEIQSGNIQFVHDGSTNPPSYSVVASDGRMTSATQAASISFDVPPTLVTNSLRVPQGLTVILTSSNLRAADPYTSNFIFTVSNVQHGYFALVSASTTPVTSFTQVEIQNGSVQFVHDGTVIAPSYNVTVSDGRMTSSSQTSTIIFDATPMLANNALKIQQGQTVILTSNDLSATDPDGEPLTFTVSNVQHGYFALISDPTSSITSFTQAQIQSGVIEFISDGGLLAPSYDVTVSDGYTSTSPPSTSIVNFTLSTVNPAENGGNNAVRNAIIGGTVSGGLSLFFLILKLYLTQRAAKNLKQILEGDASDTEKKQAAYYKEVIRPVANKIFERIKTANFLGYRSENDTKAYISAIETIIGKLMKLGVNLNLKEMEAAQQNLLLNEIAKQTRKHVVPERACCSTAALCSFFKPETTPQQIEDKSDEIAQTVLKAIGSSYSQQSAISDESVELSALKMIAHS